MYRLDMAVRLLQFCYRRLEHNGDALLTQSPETLDQASRVHGITPAALSALYVAASRRAA